MTIKIILGCIIYFALNLALAGDVDLTLSIEKANLVDGTLTINGTVSNVGDRTFNDTVKIRPFLVPSTGDADNRVQIKGAPLKSSPFSLSIAAHSSVKFEYSATIPAKIKVNNYLLGAFIDPDESIYEASRLNNVTENLFSLGEVNVIIPSVEPLQLDLQSDTYEIFPSYGYAQHTWRLFKHGEFMHDDYDLYALFMIIDLNNKKAFMADYEKSVWWANYGSDYVENGEYLPFDRYSNSPSFDRLPSGTYYLATWVNHRESVTEMDHSNNLDLERMTVSRFKLIDPNQSMFVFQFFNYDPIHRKLAFRSDFSSSGRFEISAAQLPVGLTISPMTGATSAGSSHFDLSVTVDPGQFSPGYHSIEVPVHVTSNVTEDHVLKLDVFVHNQPMNSDLIDGVLDFNVVKPKHTMSATLRLGSSNPGVSKFKLTASNQWILLPTNTEIITQQNEIVSIPIGVDSRLLPVGPMSTGTVTVISSDDGTPTPIPVTVRVSEPAK